MSLTPESDYLLLVDASSFAHRSFHAIAPLVRRKDDMQVGMLSGFCWSMLKLVILQGRTALKRRPTHAAIILDSRGKNFRHGIYPLYKANREAYPDDLEKQLPWLPKIAKAFNIPCICIDGYEADDTIATYTRLARAEELDVVIASSDKDLCQLIDDHVIMYDAMKDRDRDRDIDNTDALIGVEAVRKKWGVFPWQMADLQALVGDTVDNIPGVPKVGPVTAATILGKFGNLDKVIEAAAWGEAISTPRITALIADHLESIQLSLRLVTLFDDVPLDEYLVEDLRLQSYSYRTLVALFEDLELPQLIRALDRG